MWWPWKASLSKGVIIALDDDQKLKPALAVTPNVVFYRYSMIVPLEKG